MDGGGKRRRDDNAALWETSSVIVAAALAATVLTKKQVLQSRDKRIGLFLCEGAQDEAVGADDDEAIPALAEQMRVR